MTAIFMNKKNKLQKIYWVCFVYIFLIRFVSVGVQAGRTCEVPEGDSGCCTYGECGPWTNICFAPTDTVPTTCPAPEGHCSCGLGYPGYCNSEVTDYCGSLLYEVHQCDKCCCSLSGSGGPGSGGCTSQERGEHVGSECTYNSSTGKYEIRSWGWACDCACLGCGVQQDVHIYRDNVNATNPDLIIAAGKANQSEDYGATNCGGTPNHGFNLVSYSTANISAGSHTISVYQIDPNATFNKKLTNSDRVVNCEACTPVDGTYGDWGACTNGKQTRPCNGASCGGTCPDKDGHGATRPCAGVIGVVWSDSYPYNGYSATEDDDWSGDSNSSCTVKRNTSFRLSFSYPSSGTSVSPPDVVLNPTWGCNGGNTQSYYNSGVNIPIDLKDGKLTLTGIPSGYRCENWTFTSGGISLSGTYPTSGTGVTKCEANINNLPSGVTNHLWWKLCKPDCVYGAWDGVCSNGVETRTATPVCGGSCTDSVTRPCLRIDGNIWSDDNKDGKNISDYWKKDLNSPSGCSTTKIFPGFSMTISGETSPLNQISDWWCHSGGYGVYYNTPLPNAIEPESTKTANLNNIPAGYEVLSWNFRYLKDGVITSKTGPGSIASNLLMPPYANWVNLNWELKQQTYNLTINVKKILPEIIDLPGKCNDSNIYDGVLQGAQITIRDADTSDILCSGTSNSAGKLTCPIWILQGALHITATKPGEGFTPETYLLRCPNNDVYVYEPDHTPVKNESISTDIGLQTRYKDGWVSAIDTDIFANTVSVVVPDGPTDNSDDGQIFQGFAKTLINSSLNTEKSLGFIFSEADDRSNPDIERPCPDRKGFETTDNHCTNLGGFSYNLISGGEHDSKWLASFTFKPPEDAKEYTSKGNNFKSGEIYKISTESGDEDILPSSYSITDGDSVSVLYIDGDLTIKDNLTTASNGRLLLVVDGSVTITTTAGEGIATFNMSNDPHIEAGIIASGKIEFKSIGGLITETNHDKPIMVLAPLITKNIINGGIIFSRDLYHTNNAVIPSESAKAFNKYLYLLTSLEREKSQENLYFTGVTTYDLDWEYIY